jgi:transcriptional regulator with XRE-family HTH domain
MKANSKKDLEHQMKDEAFFRDLGERIAELRQRDGMTQAELAERLGLRQQVVATYENATRRLPSSLMLPLCEIFGVTLDELFGVEKPKGKPGRVPKLQQQFEAISHLPKGEQKFFSQMIERFLNEQAAGVSS